MGSNQVDVTDGGFHGSPYVVSWKRSFDSSSVDKSLQKKSDGHLDFPAIARRRFGKTRDSVDSMVAASVTRKREENSQTTYKSRQGHRVSVVLQVTNISGIAVVKMHSIHYITVKLPTTQQERGDFTLFRVETGTKLRPQNKILAFSGWNSTIHFILSG
jgi:hypothetical protein